MGFSRLQFAKLYSCFLSIATDSSAKSNMPQYISKLHYHRATEHAQITKMGQWHMVTQITSGTFA